MKALDELISSFRMGICLDTGRSGHALTDGKQNGKRPPNLVLSNLAAGGLAPLVIGGGSGLDDERGGEAMELTPTTPHYHSPPADTPAPVIFFLGGPGSGKTTYAQNLADIHDRYRHINMALVISQHIKENARETARSRSRSYKGRRQSFSEKIKSRLLSPPASTSPPKEDLLPTIAAVDLMERHRLGPPEHVSPSIALALLARELHSAPRTSAFLVSGYPRNLDDLDQYIEKLGRPAGAVLIEWDRLALVRNIELGHIEGAILLDWDSNPSRRSGQSNSSQTGLQDGGLHSEDQVSKAIADAARRELTEFQARVLPLCDKMDNMGVLYVVSGERPQEQVFKDVQRCHDQIMKSVALHPSIDAAAAEDRKGSYREYRREVPFAAAHHFTFSATGIRSKNAKHKLLPPMLFVLGGPGSNKGALVQDIMYLYPGWSCILVGALLRQIVEDAKDGAIPEGLSDEKTNMVRELMVKGELINQDLTLLVLERKILQLSNSEGIVIVGYPRDVIQAQTFEEKFGQVPMLVLIDCSELELGRNLGRRETRLDDNVSGAHRRLALYRKVTLPMLKAFDEKNRLRIIDGDADEEQVARDLKRAIYVETQRLSGRHENLRKKHQEESADALKNESRPDYSDMDPHYISDAPEELGENANRVEELLGDRREGNERRHSQKEDDNSFSNEFDEDFDAKEHSSD